MRMVFGLVLLVGVALAGFAVYMAQGYLAQTQSERDQLLAAQAAMPKMVAVVVAKKDLKYGDRFTKDDLDIVPWQADKLPEGTFNAITAPSGADPAIVPVFLETETRPRAVMRNTGKNEPILAKKVTDPGVDAGILANLTPGLSATTINVDAASGVSGFLRPGDKVDVYWSGSSNGNPVTKLLQRAVKVIAIDQSSDADRADQNQVARTVTVEAPPEQVAGLAMAQRSGYLTLALVAQNAGQDTGTIEVDQNKLLGITPDAGPVAVAPDKVCTVKQNRGGEIVDVVIPCPN